MMINRVLEITFSLIVLYLVLSRAQGFSQSIGAISGAYVESVRTLQGR